MHLESLWLTDFRSYPEASLTIEPGVTAILAPNGQGKTNVLEAIGWLATLSSFRGAPNESVVRSGATQAVVRAEGRRDDRSWLIECEIRRSGRGRVLVNKQRLARTRDLVGTLRVSVFAPDDLDLVKGGPALRRGYLDDACVSLAARVDSVRTDVDRVLRQRNTLLRQSGGRLSPDVATTLDVWDEQLAHAGAALARARVDLVERVAPIAARIYRDIADSTEALRLRYAASWDDPTQESSLRQALEAARGDDLRRGVTTVGPHRDELVVDLDGLSARTQASQGEQRSIALALRLAAHEVVTDVVGEPPVLLLDDVFSELDPHRSAALVEQLPRCQTVLTAAGELPHGVVADAVVRVVAGELRRE